MNNSKSTMFIHRQWLNRLSYEKKNFEISVKKKRDIEKQIQQLSLCAILSIDMFSDTAILTGGSVLNLAYNIYDRVSADIDISLEKPISPHEYAKLETELDMNFSTLFLKENYKILNSKLEIKSLNLHNKFFEEASFDPREILCKYIFQLIELHKYEKIYNQTAITKEQKELFYRENVVTLSNTKKFFEIDIKWEGPILQKKSYQINNYTVTVPSPFVLLCKKIIGILANSPHIGNTPEKFKRARAQDFFDAHSLIVSKKIHLQELICPTYLAILKKMLDGKNIDISSLKNLKDYRTFHQNNFIDSVQNLSMYPVQNFDYYFDFVIHLVEYMYPFLSTLNSGSGYIRWEDAEVK